jgi:hypothetical protein
MSRSSLVPFVVLGVMSLPLGATGQPSPPQLPAQLIEVEGVSHTYGSLDYNKRVVTVPVPAQSLADIETRNPDGSVQATIIAIDLTTNRVKARTELHQVLVLAVAPADLAHMQIGDTYTLLVRPRARP